MGNVLLVGSALFAWRATSSLATPDDLPHSVALAALAALALVIWRGQRQGWGRRLSGGLGVARDATLGAWLAMADAVDSVVLFLASGSGAILTVAGATALVLALGYLLTALALAWHGQPFLAEATATALAGLAASVLTWAGYTRLGQPAKPARTPFGGPMPRPGLAADQFAILRVPGQAWAFRVSEVRTHQPVQNVSTYGGTHVASFPLGPVEITVTGYAPIAVDLAEVDAFAQAAHIRQGGRPTPKPAPPSPPAQAPDPPPDPDPVPSRVVRVPHDVPVSYGLLADLAEDDHLALNLLWLSWPLVKPYWPGDKEGFWRRRYGLALRLTREYGLTGTAARWALDTWEACL